MIKARLVKKYAKGLLSLLLIIAVMVSMAVPLTVNAEEIVAENSEIYAILYYIDASKLASDKMTISNDKNIELVFQKGNTLDSAKTVVTDKNGNRGIFSIVDNPTNYTGSSNDVPATPWYLFNSTSSNQNIARVVFKDRIKPVNIDGWFRNCKNLEYENILHKENLDTSVCTFMRNTFSKCNKFTDFVLSDWTNFDYSQVTNMNFMFSECASLYSMDLSGVDYAKTNPANCTTMRYMFSSCPKLHSMDLTGFDPEYCENCSYMFANDTSLKSIKFGSFRAGNAIPFNDKKYAA